MSFVNGLINGFNTFGGWISKGLGQTADSYCTLTTADSKFNLVAVDGSLISIIKLDGLVKLVGQPEFIQLHDSLLSSWRSNFQE